MIVVSARIASSLRQRHNLWVHHAAHLADCMNELHPDELKYQVPAAYSYLLCLLCHMGKVLPSSAGRINKLLAPLNEPSRWHCGPKRGIQSPQGPRLYPVTTSGTTIPPCKEPRCTISQSCYIEQYTWCMEDLALCRAFTDQSTHLRLRVSRWHQTKVWPLTYEVPGSRYSSSMRCDLDPSRGLLGNCMASVSCARL